MQQQGTVTLIDTQTGRFALRLEDGSYVLAEQLDARPLQLGQPLAGEMAVVGTESFTEVGTDARYGAFVLAYGLSREAVEQELR